MADGHLNKCKECCKRQADDREKKLRNDTEWVEQEKTRAREKYNRLGYKDKHKSTPEQKKIIVARYHDKYPEKKKATMLAQHLKPKTKGNHLHHWSYNTKHVKDVIELSVLDHNKLHRFMIYDQERMMYRIASTGELLDTKEKHLSFFHQL